MGRFCGAFSKACSCCSGNFLRYCAVCGNVLSHERVGCVNGCSSQRDLYFCRKRPISENFVCNCEFIFSVIRYYAIVFMTLGFLRIYYVDNDFVVWLL